MSETAEARNKAIVLEAFDALFNQRDYAKAELYWSPNWRATTSCSTAASGASTGR